MAVRSTMIELIHRVRQELSGATTFDVTYTDDQIQDALDQNRQWPRYMPLTELETIAPGGSVSYKEFQAEYGLWERDAVLVDGGYGTITVGTADYLTGYFSIGTAPIRPVMITGKHYDICGAAADVLDTTLVSSAPNVFNFKTNDLSYDFSLTRKELASAANRLRARSWNKSARMLRNDMQPDTRKRAENRTP